MKVGRQTGSYVFAAICGCALLLLLGGCNILGAVAGSSPKEQVKVKARYTDFVGKRVAVIVAVDPNLEAMHSEAIRQIELLTSIELPVKIPGAIMADPTAVRTFATDNPYWSAMRYDRLADRLGVDRVVLIDLSSLELRDPRFRELWFGTVRARVGVIERENAGVRNLVMQADVASTFPEDRTYGTVEANSREIVAGLTQVFARDVVRLFHDHTVER